MYKDINRVEEVSHSDSYKDETMKRPLEDALDLFREALSRTKGKCNNQFAWMIALNANSTLDDIIRLGSNADSRFGSKPFRVRRAEKLSQYERERVASLKRWVCVSDTYIKPYLESKGLWSIDLANSCASLRSDWLRDINYDDRARKLKRVLDYSKYIDSSNKFVQECNKTFAKWIESINLSVNEQDWSQDRKEFFDKELEWLNKAPASIRETISQKEDWNTRSLTQAVYNAGLFNHYPGANPGRIEVCELAKAFVDTMEHIGIGIADTANREWNLGLPRLRIGVKALMKKAISTSKLFVRLVKQGYEPALARAEVVDQLNQYVGASKLVVKWQFFALEDAPESYDYQPKPKVKKASTTKGGSKSRKSRPETFEIDGVELRID